MNFLLLLCTALACAFTFNSSEAAELKPGDPAPDFTLTGSDGKTYALKDFAGKQPVVIAWFPKAFTGGCTIECKSLRDASDRLKKLNVAYFAASTDDVETNTKFAESLELNYPILSDPVKDTAKAYGVVHAGRSVPQRWTFFIGADGKILAIEKNVKTESHGQDVAAKLAELGIIAQ